MVSYTDLSPIKQPDAPVAVDLNEPVAQPAQQQPQSTPTHGSRKHPKAVAGEHASVPSQSQIDEWRQGWDQMHSKVLYFWGVTENSLAELQMLFKACRGTRLNVDPHESISISGNVEFRNVYDTERAMAVLNKRVLNGNNGILMMSPLPYAEIEQPPNGGYICIKHIPEEASEISLFDFLRPVGPVYSCSIPTHANGQRKDFGHAWFVDEADATEAAEQLNYADYLGNTVSIQPSRPPRHPRKSLPGHHGGVSVPTSPAATTPTKVPDQQRTPVASPSAPVPQQVQPQQVQPQQVQPQQAQEQEQQEQQSQQSIAPAVAPASPQSSLPSQQAAYQQSGRHTASPSGLSDGPGNGLGGIIVPGKLFITNLHPTVSHKELFALFKSYGYIQSARVSIEPTTKKSRGHGIVQFSNPNSALQAIKECQGMDIKGRKITMYQYEHVNRQNAASPRGTATPTPSSSSIAAPASSSSAGNPSARAPSAAGSPSAATPSAYAQQQQQATVPVQKSGSANDAPVASDPLLDPIMLQNLTENARREILAQKLISEIASNPAVDVKDASRIVDDFLKRPVEDIIALLSDPSLLASEWELEQKANSAHAAHLSDHAAVAATSTSSSKATAEPVESVASKLQYVSVADTTTTTTTTTTAVAAATAAAAQSTPTTGAESAKERSGVYLQDYDTETEEYIEMLLSKSENERKKKLGSKLFPLIKGMGYKESTKLTVWILDHMSQDVRSLAYTLNDRAKLREIVNEALRSI